jgi:hypothetical protein
VRAGAGAVAMGLVSVDAPALAATAGVTEARQGRARALVEAIATRPAIVDAGVAAAVQAAQGEAFATSLDTAARAHPPTAAVIDAFLDALPDRAGTDFAALSAPQRLDALTTVLDAASHAPYGSPEQRQAIAIYDAVAAVQVFLGAEHPVPEQILVEG